MKVCIEQSNGFEIILTRPEESLNTKILVEVHHNNEISSSGFITHEALKHICNLLQP